jgi:hypothetical protein
MSSIVKVGQFLKHPRMKECHLCDTEMVENEKQFLLYCPASTPSLDLNF